MKSVSGYVLERGEVRQYDIRVAAVCPGSVYTEFGSGLQSRRKDVILHIEDVAHAVLAIMKLPVTALMSEIDLRPTNPKK